MFSNKKKEQVELGFGTKDYKESVRFLNRDGSVNIKRKSSDRFSGFDIYHWLITISWTKLIVLILISYVFVNTLFALMYYFIGANQFGGIILTTGFENFLQLFFFSAQTLTTVGYGHIYPNSSMVGTLAAIESLIGLMGFALATGVLYGRFSKPKADIEYSEYAVVAPFKDATAFMFRVANRKQNELIESECQVNFAINNPETNKREFFNLQLQLSKINFLAISWTIVHPIDEKSPLKDLSQKDLMDGDAEFIILLKAINDTYSQTVYSRFSYKANEVIWGAKFTPVKQESHSNGSISIHLKDIHSIERL